MKKTILGILVVMALCLFVGKGMGIVYAQSTEQGTDQELQQGTESGQGMPQEGESQSGQSADQGTGSSQGEPTPSQ